MKEQCTVFDVECGYISTCYRIREERCLESMRKAGIENLPAEDATTKEKEIWMTGVLREIRLNDEGKWEPKKNKTINIFKRKK